MKNIAQINRLRNSINSKRSKAKILDFREDYKNHFVLKLKIDGLKFDNYRLVLLNNQLTVIMFESIEFNKPVHLHNYRLNELMEDTTYEEFQSIDFKLPENDFYLINHKVIFNGLLKITLGKIHLN